MAIPSASDAWNNSPPLKYNKKIDLEVSHSVGVDGEDPFTVLVLEEEDHEIKFRTLSWQRTAILLFGEYVCLAILALAWSWSVVGWVSVAVLQNYTCDVCATPLHANGTGLRVLHHFRFGSGYMVYVTTAPAPTWSPAD
jgi:hypothetical protein